MQYTDTMVQMALGYAPRLLLAIVLVVAGLWVIGRITRILGRTLERSNLTADLSSFLTSLLGILFKVLLLFSVAEVVGIETTSFVALLAAAGFAVGMALQGSLGNFAAGIIIILFKPYRVGDWVEVQGKFGKVQEIEIFSTIVETPGLNRLIIPNGQVIDGIVTNFSARGLVRLQLQVTMPYSESFPRVKQIIEGALADCEVLLKEPAPEIGIEDFDSHSVVLAVRPYCRPDDYWDARFSANAAIKAAFSAHAIEVAYSEGVELGAIGT